MSNRDSNVRSLERKRKAKKRNRALIIGAVIVLGGLAAYAAYFSNWLTVTKVTVTGNSIATTAQIVTDANIQFGIQLARVNSDEINENLSDISSIDHVEVRRAWPHEIILVVSERIAVATIHKSNYWVFVDAKGVEYGKTFNQPKDLMVLNVRGKAARVEVAKVWSNLPGWIKVQVKNVSATSRDNVQLQLGNSRAVIIGDSSRLERKLSVLKVLMTRKARIFDVSAPDVPVTRK